MPDRGPGRGITCFLGAALLVATALCRPGGASVAPAVHSPFNGAVLSSETAPARYSFVIAGHLYGSQNTSIFPSASVLASLERFNAPGVTFVALLGDIVRRVDAVNLDALETSFARRVRSPVFNAIGNHDTDDAGVYRARYGPTTFHFRHGSELFVFLDGERDDGDICGDQLALLLRLVREARETPGLRNVFIFCHRLVWAIGNPPLDLIVPFVNGPESHPAWATTFARQVLPELRALSGKHVYLVSGDVGMPWSLPLFYEEDGSGNVTYVATGIGDTLEDTVLLAHVDRGEVRFEPVSLTGHGWIRKIWEREPSLLWLGLDTWLPYFGKATE